MPATRADNNKLNNNRNATEQPRSPVSAVTRSATIIDKPPTSEFSSMSAGLAVAFHWPRECNERNSQWMLFYDDNARNSIHCIILLKLKVELIVSEGTFEIVILTELNCIL